MASCALGSVVAFARDARALGAAVRACRRRGLPALSAIVVRQDTGLPGNG